MQVNEFITQLDEAAIVKAIALAESQTSGEIRLYVSDDLPHEPLVEAEKTFAKLGMEKTKLRNAVLIYFAPRVRGFAIVGDSGVHAQCGADFWQVIFAEMKTHLAKEEYTQAILLCVDRVGKVLAKYFPGSHDDTDELSNEIVRS